MTQPDLRTWFGALLAARAIRIGIAILLLSAMVSAAFASQTDIDVCSGVLAFDQLVDRHPQFAMLVIFLWSLALFLTVLPLGTTTIVVAGYFLGPAAGVAQFLSLCLASPYPLRGQSKQK